MTLTGRTGTLVVIAAIVSLCINLVLAGAMVGSRWHGGPGRHGPFWGDGRLMADVPEDARPLIKQVFESHRPEFQAQREAVEQARLKVAELLKADTIDRQQLDLALGELLQRTQSIQKFGHQVLVDVAEKLPPEMRREMADRWAKDRFRMKP
jgi:Spy/CpxP family protein refolding chaperone